MIARFAAVAIVLIVRQAACADLLGTWPVGGGKVTVRPTGPPVLVSRMQFDAELGVLTQGTNPSPFSFFIQNASQPGQVNLTLDGARAVFAGPVELDVTVSPRAKIGDITATWSPGVEALPFPLNIVPEPNMSCMATEGLLMLLGLRTRRS